MHQSGTVLAGKKSLFICRAFSPAFFGTGEDSHSDADSVDSEISRPSVWVRAACSLSVLVIPL